MSINLPSPSREDVLDAFAVEPAHDRETLEHYLRKYPDYAGELVDLSRELARLVVENDEAELSDEDRSWIDAAWIAHQSAAPPVIPDPLLSLGVAEMRHAAKLLDVPRQVVSAFREKRVILTSVPRRFLARLAEALKVAIDVFSEAAGADRQLLRSHKADVKPIETPVTFEQLLIDAGVPAEKRRQLLTDDN